jgi:hypothetical protein
MRTSHAIPPAYTPTLTDVPTIFGPEWEDLRLADVQAHLAEADDEPLPWEAKGTKLNKREVRRQVGAFANGHDDGYLILGARANPDNEAAPRWLVEGVHFPDEPRTWITNVIADPDGGVRPRPRFDVHAWPVGDGHVAVVWVAPISTPPCIANGSVYERLPGKSQEVSDPLVLADLYRRGDEARGNARAAADNAAATVLKNWLDGAAGTFSRTWGPVWRGTGNEQQNEDEQDDPTAHVRFAVGVAATGNPPNISGRLFRDELVTDVWHQLRDRSPDSGRSPDAATWAQEALTWRHHATGFVDIITIVRAAWDGSVAVGQKLSWEDVYPDSLTTDRIAPQWQLADELVRRLEGFGEVYVTVVFAGGRFPKRDDPQPIVMRRGPIAPGVDDEHVASLGRELNRAHGGVTPEP